METHLLLSLDLKDREVDLLLQLDIIPNTFLDWSLNHHQLSKRVFLEQTKYDCRTYNLRNTGKDHLLYPICENHLHHRLFHFQSLQLMKKLLYLFFWNSVD